MSPHILAGVDFSDGALAALLEAQVLARLMRFELRLMHVREDAADTGDTELEARWLDLAGVTADRLQFRLGRPWIELAREAGESRSGMLVVGSCGRSGVQAVGLGSTIVRLGLIAPCPLLVVGPRAAASAQSRTRRHPAHAWPSTPSGD